MLKFNGFVSATQREGEGERRKKNIFYYRFSIVCTMNIHISDVINIAGLIEWGNLFISTINTFAKQSVRMNDPKDFFFFLRCSNQ